MNDADLVIIESWKDVPLKGGCSACPDVIFDGRALIGNKRQQEVMLTAMFSVHFHQVHQPPDQLLTNGSSRPPKSGKRSRRKPSRSHGLRDNQPTMVTTPESFPLCDGEMNHWADRKDL